MNITPVEVDSRNIVAVAWSSVYLDNTGFA